MADPYHQGIRGSLEDSRSPYRVNHNVLKTTLANSTAPAPRPSATNNYNPYATQATTPTPQSYPPPQTGSTGSTGSQPQQHQSQPHTVQTTPSSYPPPTTTTPPTGYPPQSTPTGYPPQSTPSYGASTGFPPSGTYTPPSTNTPTYSPQTSTPSFPQSAPSGYPPTGTPSGYPPSGYPPSDQHGPVQHSQSQPLPQTYNQPTPYSAPQHAASLPTTHNLPPFTPNTQVPSGYPPSQQNQATYPPTQQSSQPTYPPTQPISQPSGYPPPQQASQPSYPTQQPSQSPYPQPQPASQPSYPPTQQATPSPYPQPQQASQSAYPPQYPPTHQQSHPSLHPQSQPTPQQPQSHSSQPQLQQPQAFTPQQTPSQSYPGSSQPTPQQFPSQPSLHVQPSPYAQPTPSQVSPYSANLPPPQSQPHSQSHSPQVSQPNSQQHFQSPAQHSASQSLEPKSTPLSSFGQGSGHPTSSEEDFQLRKNFSVIGGIKKVKPQHAPMQMIQIDPGHITREYPHLARGSFGIVYKGRMAGRNEKIVIKDLEIQNQKSIDDWKKELDVMSQCLSNPYAAQVYGYSSSGNILSIIMEFFPKGDLYKVLHTEKDKHPLSLLQRMRMARHTALAISNMHEVGLMHRDIKSMNILVTEDYECKLTDFGCTKLVNDRQIHNTANTGTPLWMAPEVLQGNYNFSADVYSIGLVLFEIFERKLPEFEPSVGVKLPTRFMSASVVLPCLTRDPTTRPTASDVVKIVDKLLKSMLDSMKDLLQPAELAIVSSYITSIEASQEHDLSDFLDVNLLALYNYLLTKSPKEMDKLIETAYAIDLSEDLGPFVPVNPPVVNSGPIPSYSPYVPPTHVQPYAVIPSYPQYGAPQSQYGAQQPYGYPQQQPQPYMMPQQVRPQPGYGPTMY